MRAPSFDVAPGTPLTLLMLFLLHSKRGTKKMNKTYIKIYQLHSFHSLIPAGKSARTRGSCLGKTGTVGENTAAAAALQLIGTERYATATRYRLCTGKNLLQGR
jgi:hypothetical protein